MIGFGLGLGLWRQRGGGVAYEPEAAALFARFTTAPTSARKLLINDLITALKEAGVWSKLDALYLPAAADAQAARRNWIADAYNLSTVNSPTFTADRGYAGNGTSARLATGFNPSSSPSPKYQQNACSLGTWSRTDNNNATFCDIGSNSVISSIRPRVAGDLAPFINGSQIVSAVPSSIGFSSVSRSGINTLSVYKNGSLLVSGAAGTTGIPSFDFTLLCRNGSTPDQFSPNQIPAAFIGGSLSDGEQAELYSAVNTYLTEIGAA